MEGKEMELLTVIEAAELSRMSAAWWRQRIFRKEVRFLKVGRRVLIPRDTVDDLLAQAVVEPKNKAKAGL
jgi:excisionase family DNA binding protein